MRLWVLGSDSTCVDMGLSLSLLAVASVKDSTQHREKILRLDPMLDVGSQKNLFKFETIIPRFVRNAHCCVRFGHKSNLNCTDNQFLMHYNSFL